MSIVVFWMEAPGISASESFDDSQLLAALALTQTKRNEGKRHVCISSELSDSVGQPGVDAVAGGRLPNGEVYDWNKRHRANPVPKG